MKKMTLTNQLIFICTLIVGIIFTTLGIILPKELLPIYEENIYNKLKQPLVLVGDSDDFKSKNQETDTDIAYIYIIDDNVLVSSNINLVINDYSNKMLNNITEKYGRFYYKTELYYYYTMKNNQNEIIISITNDDYINTMRNDILFTILLITGISFTICSLLLVTWSNNLVGKIIKLKKKIDNIDNDNYNISINHSFDDEIASLNESIDNMKQYLKKQEEYKNQTYQNISHDFKTPITVIKSYIEATEDGIETEEKSLEIIKEQINKLENKVHSLLYLNKLDYIKDKNENLNTTSDVSTIINSSIKKFKLIRSDLKFIVDIDESTIFRGNEEMWEIIIDNLLNNFMRYAKKEVKITIKNKKIILFNDGDNIDEKILNNIFTPYKKGINGMFGLGLSIVKKTLQLLNYDITVVNLKNGINFIIK